MESIESDNQEAPGYIPGTCYEFSYTSVDGEEIEFYIGEFSEIGELDDKGAPLDAPGLGETRYEGVVLLVNGILAEKIKSRKAFRALSEKISELEFIAEDRVDSDELIQRLNTIVDNYIEKSYNPDDDLIEPNQSHYKDTWGYPSEWRVDGEYED